VPYHSIDQVGKNQLLSTLPWPPGFLIALDTFS